MVAVAFTTSGSTATGAPTKRTTPARISDVVNVNDWGAKGDGITNDTAAIQAAIARAYSLPSGGATVFFPRGTYIVGSPGIQLSKNSGGALNIVGAGRDVSIIKGNLAGFLLAQTPPTGNFDSLRGMKHITVDRKSTRLNSS